MVEKSKTRVNHIIKDEPQDDRQEILDSLHRMIRNDQRNMLKIAN